MDMTFYLMACGALVTLLFLFFKYTHDKDKIIENLQKIIDEYQQKNKEWTNEKYHTYNKNRLKGLLLIEIMSENPNFCNINQYITTLKGYYDKERT